MKFFQISNEYFILESVSEKRGKLHWSSEQCISPFRSCKENSSCAKRIFANNKEILSNFIKNARNSSYSKPLA